MSPRAACRLETLGFQHVYDYVAGKADWLARGLPREGTHAAQQRAIDYARHDVVTCELSDTVGHVRERVEASPHGFALVVSAGGVLLGRLGKARLDADPRAIVDAAMEPGPSTIRADTPPYRLRERLEARRLTTAVITDPDGRFVGIVRTEELPAGE